jgi:AhpC/TSA family
MTAIRATSVGDRAADFVVPAVDGSGSLALADFTGRQPVFLGLYRGLHCPFCRRHLAQLDLIRAKLEPLGVATVAIVNTPLDRARLYSIRFERKFETGVKPRSPNLDIILSLGDNSVLAIESKFSEPFGGRSQTPIQEKYFPPGRSLWSEVGLTGPQRIADSIRSGTSYGLVGAPQLLKHMLGLAQQSAPWRLLFLWYSPTREHCKRMEMDIARFREALGSDAAYFSTMTYQSLWVTLAEAAASEHSEYVGYITRRYFAGEMSGRATGGDK